MVGAHFGDILLTIVLLIAIAIIVGLVILVRARGRRPQ